MKFSTNDEDPYVDLEGRVFSGVDSTRPYKEKHHFDVATTANVEIGPNQGFLHIPTSWRRSTIDSIVDSAVSQAVMM